MKDGQLYQHGAAKYDDATRKLTENPQTSYYSITCADDEPTVYTEQTVHTQNALKYYSFDRHTTLISHSPPSLAKPRAYLNEIRGPNPVVSIPQI